MGPYTPHESFQLENQKNHKKSTNNRKSKRQKTIQNQKGKTIFFMKSFQKVQNHTRQGAQV